MLDHILPFISERFGVAPPKIGLFGTSMGGQGALRFGFKYPAKFPVVVGISPAIDYQQRIREGDETLGLMYRDAEDARPVGDSVGDEVSAGPERAAHNARLRPMLTKALASLPEEQREVFLLREYHGISFKEIADVTGVNENTVKSRMRYALEGLRKRLSELGVDGELVTDGRTVA